MSKSRSAKPTRDRPRAAPKRRTEAPRGDLVDQMLRDVQRTLAASTDATYGAALGRSIGTDVRVMGVRVPDIRESSRGVIARFPGATIEDVAGLMDRCAAGRVREEMLVGTFILARRAKHLTAALLNRVDGWIDSIDNWETCDQLATGVAAVIIAKDPAEVDRLTSWAKSTNAWRRRFAAVTAAGLNQKGRRFPSEALSVCVHVLNDPDPLVRKAVAWAIREVAIVDPGAARQFVAKHARSMHPSVLKQTGLQPAATR